MARKNPAFQNLYLRVLDDEMEEVLIIPATNGRETIVEAKLMFGGDVDPDFITWGADQPSESKPETLVALFELGADASHEQIFTSFGVDMPVVCLTQNQIVAFCRKYPEKFDLNGPATMFLFRAGNNMLVARIRMRHDGVMRATVRRFKDPRVWEAAKRYRVVVPMGATK